MDTEPIIAFKTLPDWETWLSKHYSREKGIWMKLFKKASGKQSITYAEAVDGALCYGWIDGQKKAYDEEAWLQKFTPRRPRSMWSKVNTQHVARLIQTKRMKSSGLAAVDAAKQDGRWEKAYHSSRTAVVPEDFLSLLDKHPQAKEFFKTLTKAKIYPFLFRLQTAKKPETRARRMTMIIDMLTNGKTFNL